MVFTAIFDVKSIVATSTGGVPVFPPGVLVPPGVGVATTGLYVTNNPGHHSVGQFVYSRVNAYQDDEGRLHGIGHMTVTLERKGVVVVITSTYTTRTIDPNESFSVDRIVTPVTSATINGKLTQGFFELTPIDGGRKYRARIDLEPVAGDCQAECSRC